MEEDTYSLSREPPGELVVKGKGLNRKRIKEKNEVGIFNNPVL